MEQTKVAKPSVWKTHKTTILTALAVLSLAMCAWQTYLLHRERRSYDLDETLVQIQSRTLQYQDQNIRDLQCIAHYASGIVRMQRDRLIALGEKVDPLPNDVEAPKEGCD